jgi:hypothetical protein
VNELPAPDKDLALPAPHETTQEGAAAQETPVGMLTPELQGDLALRMLYAEQERLRKELEELKKKSDEKGKEDEEGGDDEKARKKKAARAIRMGRTRKMRRRSLR